MRPRRFPDANMVLSLPGGNEDNDLFVQAIDADDDCGAMMSCWEPTAEERGRIAAGARVNLFVLGKVHPPVMMTVGEPPA